MLKSNRKLIGAVLMGLIMGMVFLCGCTSTPEQSEKAVAGPVQTPSVSESALEKSGSLKITGSTTILPIAAKAAEVYMDQNSGLDVQVNGGGSGVGVQSAGEGTAQIGMSSRDLKAEEKVKFPNLVGTQIAIDGIAIITHSTNAIPSLTMDQVRMIYNGNITNWKDVGGSDLAIVVVGRDSASGTREFFHSDVMKKENFIQTQLEKNSNGAVKQAIEQTPGAIGYVGLGYVDGSIHAVAIDVNGTITEPTIGNVKAGKYHISRPLYLLTDGKPSGSAEAFINYILSPDGQKIVSEEGFIPLSN